MADEFTFKKREKAKRVVSHSVPCSIEMKSKLLEIHSYDDVNVLTRKFWEKLVAEWDKKKASGDVA